MRREKNNGERGAITLEACVSVTLFTIFMLFFVGLFSMFMAQQTIAHSLIQSTQSLAYETLSTAELEFEWGDKKSGLKKTLTTAITAIYDLAVDSNDYFSNDDTWYNDADMVPIVAKDRFVAYLTNGDETAADEYLKGLRVVDGLEGLDFSQSKVEGGVLYTEISYQLEYMFTFGDIGIVDAKQKFCANLWGV